MSEGAVIHIFQEAIFYAILVALPALAVSLLVGLLISIIQTATALQEMTLTFVPKIIFTLITLGLCSAWMLKNLVEFTERLMKLFPGLIN
jgi:flagellar biosynthetic protein FliQ